MEHLDVTIDFETAGLSANAAVLQLGAVAWDRHATDNPFEIVDQDGHVINTFNSASQDIDPECVNFSFDLRDQVFAGREFAPDTISFWADKQKEDIKDGIISLEPKPTKDVLYSFVEWVKDLATVTGAKSVCIWSQGTDFDISILRSLAVQFNIELPRNIYKNFRDARTYIMEMGAAYFLENADEAHRNPNAVYQAVGTECPPLPFKGNVHDALYDAVRSSWNVWSIMQTAGNVMTNIKSKEPLENSKPEY